jgi:hypothetical protein
MTTSYDEDQYQGKRSPMHNGPVICDFCDEIAVYRGAGMKDNYRHFYNLCREHGPSAMREWVVNSLQEFREFKEWKKQQAKKNQPSRPTHLSLFRDESPTSQ